MAKNATSKFRVASSAYLCTMIRVGIIGGGQLGMMTIEAKFPSLPVEFVVLEQSADCPAAPISNQFIAGSLKSEADIRTLAEASDVLTWEIEHINVDALVQLEKEGKTIIPKPSVLQTIQDKGIQKQFFQQHNIPTAHFALCDAQSITEALLSQFPGEQIVIKTRTGGYDGKGVAILNKSEALQSMPFSGNILIESFVPNALEIAVIVAIAQDGSHAVYPAIEMYFNPKSNLVEFLFSPARISTELEKKIQAIGLQCVQKLNSPGLFAVELFLTENQEIWVNEIAPRPHNSGHHTIEGCHCSQFEQFLRILSGAPLGDPSLVQPAAMINIVGPTHLSGDYQLANEDSLTQNGDVFIHMYRKSETRPNRKLGHATVIAPTLEALLERAESVKNQLEVIAK
jgi:5-(carboxyamino)imidazole ribonucleotide synthase